MRNFDTEIRELAEKCARKQKLEANLHELYEQRRKLFEKTMELKVQMKTEQLDVDKMEGRSLYAFFYFVIGKKDEKLTKEKEEAYAARVKYDAAAAELHAVESDIESFNKELQGLKNCEIEYKTALLNKAAAIKKSGSENAARIAELEAEISAVSIIIREIREAVSAGQRAKNIADSILERLTKAENWSTYDLIAGDGLISHMIKHDHLDSAQAEIESLQISLRKFKTELTDININAGIQVNIEGFLRFADYFFDNIFVDWEIRDRIKNSKQQVSDTRYRIGSVLSKLSVMESDSEKKKSDLEKEYNLLISKAVIVEE